MLHADIEAETYRFLPALTTEETQEIAQMVEIGAMKA
jgi:hypothetical protein